MEQIIANLLVADNIVIQKATADLREAFKSPEAIPALCEIVVSSKESQHRQYSAVLLTKQLGKLRNWQLVPVEQQQLIKQGILNALINEQEKSVRNAIAQFVGTLLKHETNKDDSWMVQVLNFVFEHCRSNNLQQSEAGSAVFATLTATAPDQFIAHIQAICEMFSAALVATESSGNMATPVVLNLIKGMGNLVPFILGHNNAETTYQQAVPYIVKALDGFAVQNPDGFIEAFDILENLADYAPKLLNTSLKVLIEFCLALSSKPDLDDMVRVRACSFIGWLVRLKKKAILKQKLVEPIIQVIFNLMATAPEDEDDDEEYYTEECSPKTTATQTMDQLATYIPSEKLIPPLLSLLDPALKGDNPLYKKAAYLCIAVIAEGCSEAICNKYLRPLLDAVKTGIKDPNPIIRNAAFFALGQFSEFLQPEISQYASEILPILFDYLHSICIELRSGKEEPKHIDRMFYALETFCENLEDAIVPYLPPLLERLFETLSPNNSTKLRELALSSVASAASAAKTNMLPYFPQLIAGLNMYFVKSENEDIVELRPQAIDTLATIARTIGKENFTPITNNTMNFALTFLSEIKNDEPELRRSLYNLFAALSEVVGPEMVSVLPQVVERMLDSVKSSEETVVDYKGDEVSNLVDKIKYDQENNTDDIDIENSDGEDDDDDDILYSVENAYLDEKEQAIIALRLLAEFSGPAFVPYIQPCFEAIYKKLDHPQECIRKVAIEALAQFGISLFILNDVAGAQKIIGLIVPKYAEILKSDEDFPVCLSVFEAYTEILKKLKAQAIYTEELKVTIFSCIHDVLCGKVACQFSDNTDEEESEEGEYFVALIESAGEVLPRLGEAMQPSEFALYFGRILPIIVEKLEKAKGNEELQSDRSFAYGTISECFHALESCTGALFDSLLPLFLEGLQDEYEQARHNAVYGLGELVFYGDDKSYSNYPPILQALSLAVSQEVHPGTLDNICGALARLIITNSKLVPLEHVLPVFIQKLPLREDFDENKTIFKSFQVLLTQGNEYLLQVVDQVILLGFHVLGKNQSKDDETRDVIFGLLRELRSRFPDAFNQVISTNADAANFAQSCSW